MDLWTCEPPADEGGGEEHGQLQARAYSPLITDDSEGDNTEPGGEEEQGSEAGEEEQPSQQQRQQQQRQQQQQQQSGDQAAGEDQPGRTEPAGSEQPSPDAQRARAAALDAAWQRFVRAMHNTARKYNRAVEPERQEQHQRGVSFAVLAADCQQEELAIFDGGSFHTEPELRRLRAR